MLDPGSNPDDIGVLGKLKWPL